MFVIPPAIIENVQNIDFNSLAETINKCAPVIEAARSVWTKDTLKEMIDGNVAITDKLINDVLAEQLAKSDNKEIKSITVTSKANGKIDIMAETVSDKHIKFSGKIVKFVHNSQESVAEYKITDVPIKENGFIKWLVFNMSVPMAEKMLGNMDRINDIPVQAKGNTFTFDFTDAVDNTLLANREINGHRLIDLVEIQEAVPKDGYIAFKTKLIIPDDVKDTLKGLLHK